MENVETALRCCCAFLSLFFKCLAGALWKGRNGVGSGENQQEGGLANLAARDGSGAAQWRGHRAAGGHPGGQDQPHAHHGGAGRADVGPRAGGWPRRHRRACARAQCGDGVPAVHQLPVADRGAEHRVTAQIAGAQERRCAGERAGRAAAYRHVS
ncbi:hypothetical protein SDC9_80232 [bioreactor metagenome]|uniref:Uncharacterized protein n=1 Tax=bioreactor metagenome TaxID=1076179 RepID=A0A644YYF8_9ZZZZ